MDPFSANNGFNPNGDSVYSSNFVERYSRAQSRRMNDLIKEALDIKNAIEADKHFPKDDDAFIFYRDSARLSDFSTGVHGSTVNPADLLKNDGTIESGKIVKTVRAPDPSQREEDESFAGLGC